MGVEAPGRPRLQLSLLCVSAYTDAGSCFFAANSADSSARRDPFWGSFRRMRTACLWSSIERSRFKIRSSKHWCSRKFRKMRCISQMSLWIRCCDSAWTASSLPLHRSSEHVAASNITLKFFNALERSLQRIKISAKIAPANHI